MSRKASPRFWLACCLLGVALAATARPNFDTDNPLSFFTNVANRLLLTLPATYGNLSISNIPICQITATKTNFPYTPAVQRLLQLAANLYDATTNRASFAGQTNQFLPSVFRPIFTKSTANTETNVWISSYVEVTNDAMASFNLPCVEAEFLATNPAVPAVITGFNVYNAPWIIGAKKGLPNFNEFELLNGIQVLRRLEFQRANPNGDPNDPANTVAYTNQLFALTFTNSLGMEAWNSYSNSWDLTARPLRMILTNEFTLQVTNTNSLTFNYVTNFVTGTNYLVDGNSNNMWMGYNTAIPRLPPAASFCVPLTNSMIVAQANVISLQSAAGFQTVTNGRYLMPFAAGPYPLPRWQVNLNTHVRYALIDENAGRVVDYVNLSQTQPTLDLAWELAGRTNGWTSDNSPNGAWYTNALVTNNVLTLPPAGVSVGLMNQLLTGLGILVVNSGNYKVGTTYGPQFFAYNLGLTSSTGGDPTIYRTNIFDAPYDAYRTIYQRMSWEANDPLVHYTAADLTDPSTSQTIYRSGGGFSIVPPDTLGKLNNRYQPWGGNPGKSPNAFAYSLALKDPLVFRPDAWDFPTNKSAALDWLGRVHRGTPWQTLYLKSAAIDFLSWTNWIGNDFVLPDNSLDAITTMPTNDWRLASLLVSVLSTNDPRPLLSVNSPDTNAWAAIFDGLIVLTNTTPAFNANQTPTFLLFVLSSNDPVVMQIAASINNARTTGFNGAFKQIGDLLSVPILSIASPYLNTNFDPADLDINDEEYEKLPSQLLPLLRPDSTGAITGRSGGLQLQFSGGDGYSYAVETSTNFQTWSVLATNSPQGGVFPFTAPLLPGPGIHAYRTELLP